ncbi:flagellar biosynthesis anti-sigma factor FlgM [Escherichia coli]|nr:flagellar biosynthesis anti-sigma factor FlgM [Escherichia coli]
MKITPTMPQSPDSHNGRLQPVAQKHGDHRHDAKRRRHYRAGLQSAQQTLNDQQESDIDSDKVAQMQAMLASGSLQVDTEQLASDMLSFFQN